MKLISIIWLIFIVLFSYLSYYHYKQSKIKYPELKVTQLGNADIQFGGISIKKPLKDFAKDFNEYLQKQNNSNEKQNKFSAIGYLAATLTALLSFALSFEYGVHHANKKYNLSPYYYFKNYITQLSRKMMNKNDSNDSNEKYSK